MGTWKFRINTGALSKKTPVLFEPDEGDGLPSGLQVHEALLTLPGGNCTKIDLQVTNLTSHNIVLPSRTFLGRIQMIRSISPVEFRFKEFADNNNEQNQNEKTETDSKESESVDVNNTSFNHENVPEVKLGDHFTKDQKDYVKQMLFEERDCFISGEQDVGCAKDLQMNITLSDPTPVQQNYIAVPRPLYPELKHYIKGLLNRGFIKNSRSPYSSSCVIVRKEDGSIRLCIDYRELNKKTVTDRHPIPRIQDTLDSLAGQKWFSIRHF